MANQTLILINNSFHTSKFHQSYILMSCFEFVLKFLFVSLLLTCMLSVFFRLFLSSIALPNTRRSVSRPEQVRQIGPVGNQEQDVGVTILIASRLHQGLHSTRPVTFSTRKYYGFNCILHKILYQNSGEFYFEL